MAAQDLERIYNLKSQGYQQLLSEINSIGQAFTDAAERKKLLSDGKNTIYDPSQLSIIKDKIQDLVDLQGELVSTLKNVGTSSNQATSNVENYSKSVALATEETIDMVATSKSLGSNITSNTSSLLKMQSALASKNPMEYHSALQALAIDLKQLTEEYNSNQSELDLLNIKSASAKSILEEFSLTVENNREAFQELFQDIENAKNADEDFIVVQSQLKNQIQGVTQAMMILNKAYSPALNQEEALSIKEISVALQQENEALTINAKEQDDALSNQIEIVAARQELNRKIALGVEVLSGNLQKEIEKQEAVEKAQLEKEEAIAQKRIEIQNRIRANQELIGEAKSNSIEQDASKASQKSYQAQPQQQALIKIEQQDTRTEIELLKNQGIVASETAGYMQKLAAQLNILRIETRLLSEEDRKGSLGAQKVQDIQRINKELIALEVEMGNNQRRIGDYGTAFDSVGDKLKNFVVRDLFRATAGLIVYTALFEGISKAASALEEAIPGTDAYIKKQEELQATLEKTEEDFLSVIKTVEDFRKSLDNSFSSGQVQAQNEIDKIKAKGVVQQQVYTSESEQLKATQQLRDKQIDDANQLTQKYIKLNDIYREIDKFGDGNKVRNNIKDLGLSDDEYKKVNQQLTKFFEARKKNKSLSLYQNPSITKSISDADTETSKLIAQKQNEQTQFDFESSKKVDDKKRDLETQLFQLKEQYRQVNEKEDIQSVDKIVNDVNGKYSLLLSNIQKEREKYRLTVTTKENVGYSDGAIQYYDSIISKLKQIASQEEKNDIEDFNRKNFFQQKQREANETNAESTISSFYSNFGFADYGKMTKALDDQTEAKKKSLENEQSKLLESYRLNGQNTVNIESQYQDKLTQIDEQAYKDRLALAGAYFQRVIQNTDDASKNILSTIDVIDLQQQDKAYKKGGSDNRLQRRLNKINTNATINKSNEIIQQINSEDLPNAKDDEKQAKDALDKASNLDESTIATKNYNDAQQRRIEIEKKLAQAILDKDIAQRKAQATQKQVNQVLLDGAFKVAQTLDDSYFQLLAKQDEYRHTMAERSLAFNQRVQDSEVESNNQRLAESKANMIAQQEIDKQKAQADQKRAEQQLIVNFVIAASKAYADNPFPVAVAEDAVLAATLVVQEGMLASAPAYATGTSWHKGGLAWIGDGGENEIIQIGNKYSMSPNTPTLVNLQKGASVTPMSKIGSDMGRSLKAPSFTSSNTSSSGSNNLVDAHEKSINQLYGIIGGMAKAIANQKLVYEPKKAAKANNKMINSSSKI